MKKYTREAAQRLAELADLSREQVLDDETDQISPHWGENNVSLSDPRRVDNLTISSLDKPPSSPEELLMREEIGDVFDES